MPATGNSGAFAVVPAAAVELGEGADRAHHDQRDRVGLNRGGQPGQDAGEQLAAPLQSEDAEVHQDRPAPRPQGCADPRERLISAGARE